MKEQIIKDCIVNICELANAMSSVCGQTFYAKGGGITTALEELLFVFKNCAFQVDDKIQLALTPVIDNYTSWGWMAHKHFLIKGSTGVIRSRGIHKGQFKYEVSFDAESYIDYNTKELVLVPADKRSTFVIPESWLTKLEV